MERGGMSMSDRLLPSRFLVDGLQRQRDFNELLLHSFGCFHASRTAWSTDRRRSAVSIPSGARRSRAFAMSDVIFLSSTRQDAGPRARRRHCRRQISSRQPQGFEILSGLEDQCLLLNVRSNIRRRVPRYDATWLGIAVDVEPFGLYSQADRFTRR